MSINGNLKTAGMVTALVSAIVVGVWGEVFQRLWDPRYTEDKQNSYQAHVITTQTTLQSLAAEFKDGAEQRKEMRAQLSDIERKLDRLLWERGVDPRSVKDKR